MKLIVGLGNPGSKYAGHRHNVGFMALDLIHETFGGGPWRNRFQAEASETTLDGHRALLLKPTTYMNESGRAVGEAMRFYKTELEDVVVLHDELDLAPGKVRMKTGGGNAGHNGLRSISAHCGNEYRRVRIGIDHPGRKDLVHRWVLSDFAKADTVWLEPLLDAIARSAAYLAAGDDQRFMTEVARLTQPDSGADGSTDRTRRDPSGRANPAGAGKWQAVERNVAAEESVDAQNQENKTPASSALADKLSAWIKRQRDSSKS